MAAAQVLEASPRCPLDAAARSKVQAAESGWEVNVDLSAVYSELGGTPMSCQSVSPCGSGASRAVLGLRGNHGSRRLIPARLDLTVLRQGTGGVEHTGAYFFLGQLLDGLRALDERMVRIWAALRDALRSIKSATTPET